MGGYVRRCERKPFRPVDPIRAGGDDAWMRYSVMPSGMVLTWRAEPPMFQTAPILNFIPFEVSNGD